MQEATDHGGRIITSVNMGLHLSTMPPPLLSHLLRGPHSTSGGAIPDFGTADRQAGRPRGGRPVRVRPQRPEAAERRGSARGLGRRGLRLRRLRVLQPDPAPEERGPRGPGEDGRPAGHHRRPGDPLHLQRRLPVRTAGQEIAGARLGRHGADPVVLKPLDWRKCWRSHSFH